MAIRHVVDMIEGLDNDYNDADGYTFTVFSDPLAEDEGILGAVLEWEDGSREDEEYEIKITRVV